MRQLSVLCCAIVLAGCASAYVRAPLSAAHPASPDAPEAPLPRVRALDGGSAEPTPPSALPGHGGPHAGH